MKLKFERNRGLEINERDLKNSKKSYILMGSLCVLLVGFVYYREYKRAHELLNCNYTWAVIVSKKSGKSVGQKFKVKYLSDKKVYYSEFTSSNGCYGVRKIGDTIIIKYSLTNLETVDVVDCYWNERTRYRLREFKKGEK